MTVFTPVATPAASRDAGNPARPRWQSLSWRQILPLSHVTCQLPNELAQEDDRLYTMDLRFEWNPAKAAANLRAHRVSFAEAVTVLEDEFALTREDPDAVEEPRFVTLGLSNLGNLLVVIYAYREPDTIRVISAWKANKRQRELYEEGRS